MTHEPHIHCETKPVCAQCGRRIRLQEQLLKELEAGNVRASYALDFTDARRRPRRVWHPGCLPRGTHHLVA
jgi:hypothetical protein